ncbi:MAG: Rieske 2Fe-2S domain-containing protein [Chloroflexi bacterium]|nr:Rieske 2Fe-2S domain-containing protein [Chloroflexota bacterium]
MTTQPQPEPGEYYLCSLKELQKEGVVVVDFEHPKYRKWELALFWDGERTGALDNFCPHQGAMLSYGMIFPGEVVCPLHSAVFDIVTGECLDRYTYDATAYETFVRDGGVWAQLPGRPLPRK